MFRQVKTEKVLQQNAVRNTKGISSGRENYTTWKNHIHSWECPPEI
jgi:hypothetical protein